MNSHFCRTSMYLVVRPFGTPCNHFGFATALRRLYLEFLFAKNRLRIWIPSILETVVLEWPYSELPCALWCLHGGNHYMSLQCLGYQSFKRFASLTEFYTDLLDCLLACKKSGLVTSSRVTPYFHLQYEKLCLLTYQLRCKINQTWRNVTHVHQCAKFPKKIK